MTKTIGLDFGTSNTVLVEADSNGNTQSLQFGTGADSVMSLATVLSFLDRRPAKRPNPEAGPWAIRQFLESLGDVRFIQSLKTFVASPHFNGTGIYGDRYDFEALMVTFLTLALQKSAVPVVPEGTRLIVGRPVAFAGHTPDDALAMTRYREAFQRAGFHDIQFVLEPVAAAFSFAQTLTDDATILVADLGGGTTDFSLMRFRFGANGLTAEPLSRSGVGVAGDSFDYRIIDNVILPELGKGSQYKSMGKILDIPPNLFSNFAKWHMLSTFKTSDDYKEMKKLLRWCLEPEKIELFIELVDEDQGYPLYKSVSETKARLSSAAEAELTFAPLGSDFRATVCRDQFESWISPELEKINHALNEAIDKAGVSDRDIDRIFLTGGTSFVPTVRKQFERRFGVERLSGGKELTSVANGLALIGAREDAGHWAVAA